jgi:hypothetical protein
MFHFFKYAKELQSFWGVGGTLWWQKSTLKKMNINADLTIKNDLTLIIRIIRMVLVDKLRTFLVINCSKTVAM